MCQSIFARDLTIVFFDTAICADGKLDFVISHDKMIRPCPKPLKFDRSIHGHFVLKTFLENYKKNISEKLSIHHFNVFNDKGYPERQLWLDALVETEKIKPDLLILAVGFEGDSSHFPLKLPAITIAAAGTEGYGITQSTVLWPQNLSDPQILLLGHYFPSNLKHLAARRGLKRGQLGPDLLNKKNISYFVTESFKKVDLSGSSRAVALGAAYILNKCKHAVLVKKIDELKECLNRKNSHFLTPENIEKIELNR